MLCIIFYQLIIMIFKLNQNISNRGESDKKIRLQIPKRKTLQNPTPTTTIESTTNVIIYVLCYNLEKYNFSKKYYSKYKWARPILMKYQDYTFENAFWKQLLEISNEWETADMVGTLSHKAYEKINLEEVNHIIINKMYSSKKFVSFMKSENTLFNENHHTFRFKQFIKYISYSLNNKINYKLSYCNYWITTPELMKDFINWHTNTCLPILLKHPYCFHKYNYGGALTKHELLRIWGRPYYPNIPFILERINLLFFVNEREY